MGSVLGGIIGNIAGGDERRGARDAMSEALGAYRDIKIPTVEEQKIALQQLSQQGLLTPELEQEILAGPTAFEKISEDPQLREAQLSALGTLKQVGQLGLTPQDRAALYDIRSQVAQQDKARQDAIIQNLASRGMGGSGAELAQRLASAQSAAETQAKMASDLASQAFANRLQAISQAGTLGGNVRTQDFNQAAQKANATDVMNQFNTSLRSGVQQRNVGTKMNVQQQNLAEKQRIADQNAVLANQQEMYNKQLYQQQFQNALQKAGGLSGQLGRQADFMQQQAQNRAGMWQGVGDALTGASSSVGKSMAFNDVYGNKGSAGSSSGGSGGGSISPLAMALIGTSDKNAKENIKKDDMSDLLDKLSGYSYNYKNEKHGHGKQLGIMAQDLEKALPQAVIDTDEGKKIDGAKTLGPILASLAEIHKRLEKLEK